MIATLRMDGSKGAILIPDWPEFNPLPILDASRTPPLQFKDAAGPRPELLPGRMPSVFLGERVPDALMSTVPKVVRLRPQPRKKWPQGDLKDFQGLLMHPILSERAKTVIETLEPGVHQFFPVSFVQADTGAAVFNDTPRYLLNVGRVVSPKEFFPIADIEKLLRGGALDAQPSVKAQAANYRSERQLPNGDVLKNVAGSALRFAWPGNRWVVDAVATIGRHLFVVPDFNERAGRDVTVYHGAGGEIFVSHEFRDTVAAAKLTGATYEPCLSLDIDSGATARNGGGG